MLRVCGLVRSTSAHATLSRWTSQLASKAATLPSSSGQPSTHGHHLSLENVNHANSAPPLSSEALWEDVVHATRQAFTLKETDTIYSVFYCLIKKGYYPPKSELWPLMAKWLLTYADVECTSVLSYPGESEGSLRAAAASQQFPPNSILHLGADLGSYAGDAMTRFAQEKPQDDAVRPYYVFPSRETLLLTGGVVPLSARLPCADGRLLQQFLVMFCRYVREEILHKVNSLEFDSKGQGVFTGEEAEKVHGLLNDMSESLLGVIRFNINTMRFHFLVAAIAQYMGLLWEVDRLLVNRIQRNLEMREELESTLESSKEVKPPASLLLTFVQCLNRREMNPATSALGARLALCGVVFTIDKMVLADRGATDDVCSEVEFNFVSLLSFPGYLLSEVSLSQRRLQFEAVGSAVRGLFRYYERSVFYPDGKGSESSVWLPLASLMKKVFDFVDVSLQHNANQNNPLNMPEEVEQQLRQDVLLCWLRCLRVETASPTVFLRDSMCIVERCVASMEIEAELIAAKVVLFDYFELLEEGKQTIYDDILTSLRHLLELRPRANESSAVSPSLGAFFSDEGRNNEQEVEEQLSTDDLVVGSGSASLDGEAQEIIQTAHQLVIKALCNSHQMQCVNDAYNIVIAHKYQGLIITKEIIRPLVEALSRHGDCRVFNLVDLCVLYSNNQVDMHIIAGLFRTCAVAGDHYRARTLLQLLRDVVPGFLVKATPDIIEFLKELKVVPPEPYHLFTLEEEKLEKDALGHFADVPPREIPNLTPLKK